MKTTFTTSLLLLCSIVIFVSSHITTSASEITKESKPAAKKSPLEGVWQVTAMRKGANENAPKEIVDGTKLTFKGDKLSITRSLRGKPQTIECSFVINTEKKPMEIDITPVDDSKKRGKLLGIFEKKGDVLKLCTAEERRNEARPKKFKPVEGKRITLIEMKLKKD